MTRRCRKGCFTLVELMAAMAIFLILMAALLTFLFSSQKVWSASSSRSRLYENAGMAFEMITRDLHSSLYDTQSIPFWQKNSGELSFVSVLYGVPGTEKTNVCEVRYRMSNNELQRSLFRISDPEWDFYGNMSTSAFDDSDFETVTEYLVDLEFSCYDADGNLIPPSSGSLTPYPNSIKIDIGMLDPGSFLKWRESGNADILNDMQRNFSRTIFLGKR